MQDTDRQPIATIALIAALADGERGPEEQKQLKQIAATVGGDDFDQLTRKILSGQVRLGDVAGALSGDDARRMAYEMAVCVCNADGVANRREKEFLAELRTSFGIGAAGEVEAAAQALASAPLPGPSVEVSPPTLSSEGPRPSQAGLPAVSPDQALDDMILKQAMLTGALELLPQGIATLAIVPLQLRLVYRIGADYGHQLDGNQIKDLAGTMGVGAAGQVMEGIARKMLGGVAKGLLGRFIGGVAGGVAAAAAGAAVTFATTYALGHAAKQYYAQGRRLSRDDLRSLFARFQEEAKTLFPKVQEQIQAQSRGLKLPQLIGTIKGA